ncbi:MAG: GIY-YIG nuclease family protein [Patescibacteria group bacterium]
MYYVYVLKSKLMEEIYIGSTNDLRRRLQEHNDGKEISTKRYAPWTIFYYEAYLTEKLARLREKRLKHNGNAIRELKKRIGLI